VSFTIAFDDNNQELIISGGMTPRWAEDLSDLKTRFAAAVGAVLGRLYINVKNLRKLNNTAFVEMAKLVLEAARRRPDLRITIVTSSAIGWSTRKFGLLYKLAPNISVEVYDKDFYPGQLMTEDASFIPILRNQTRITWRHERYILPRHGLKPGLEVADICCGIGDFPVLLYKEFKPSRLVALDHSRPSLGYARQVAEEFGIRDIEFTFGDAASMLLEDDQFDFVTCRHSLLVFNRPELILKELYRICKPGGRVYITNEKNSHCLGEPYGESIQWSYNQVPALYNYFQMDIELGPRQRGLMIDAGFDEIMMESFMVTNLDGDPQEFATVIKSWERLFCDKLARQRGDSEEFIAKFRRGLQDHAAAALHPKGYAGWPIWAASGRKPL
jgi:ubiquinone/menaquinone biosynthesis C-methylase UbiE